MKKTNKFAVDIKSLHYAVELAKYKNFHRAAKALGISQPALTRTIGQLEKALKVKLFDRVHSGVEPTIYCELLVECTRDVNRSVEEMYNRIQQVAETQLGTLNIGIGHYFAHSIYAKIISRFVANNPSLKFNILEEDWENLPDLLRQGKIHFFIAESSMLNDVSDFNCQNIREIKPAVFCRSTHPLANKKKINFEQIFDYPVALIQLFEQDRRFMKMLAGKKTPVMDILQDKLSITCNSMSILRDIILHSDNLTIVSEMAFIEDVTNGSLIKLDIDAFTPYLNIPSIVTLKGRTLPPAALSLIAELHSGAQNFPAG